MIQHLVFSSLLLVGFLSQIQCLTLETYLQWSSVQFEYDSKAHEQKDIRTGKYVSSDVVILSAEVYQAGNGSTVVFVTTPDFLPGTPFSVSTVTNQNGKGGPILKPFPSAKDHKVQGDCNSITNVFRVKVDKYDRLWVADNGKFNTLRALQYICPPQILVYDLKNKNKLIRRYKVPGLSPISCLANIEFEYLDDNNKDNMVVYFNDEFGSALVVYSYKDNKSFVVNHPYFSPTPHVYPFFNLSGTTFYKMIGIDGIAISPKDKSGRRTMYFHPLTAGCEAAVHTDILRDPTRNSYLDFKNEYRLLDDRGFHSSVQLMLKNGTMIFTNLDDTSLLSWDIQTPYNEDNFVTIIQDPVRLQFPAFLQVVREKDEDQLYVTTTKLQRVVVGNPDKNTINYRILKGKL